MKSIIFEKYHALGNDFIVVDSTKLKGGDGQKSCLTILLCDRHQGIGADGVVFFRLLRGRYSMRIFNADGGEAELSGNGLRILAHYLVRKGVTRKKQFEIDSSVGRNAVIIRKRKALVFESSAYLPAAKFETKLVPMRAKGQYFINTPFMCEAGKLIGTAVSVGNPHLVFFVDNFDFDWRSFGRVAETASAFPENTNVEFAKIRTRKEVEHRIWERGAGETSASGSGAAAVAAAGVINGLLEHEVRIHEPAGELTIAISSLGEPILITGPTTFVGEGTFCFSKNA